MNLVTPDKNTFIHEYSSIAEFVDFIQNTPRNPIWREHESHIESGYQTNWTGTSSYAEALDLLQNGWSPAAERLTTALNASPAPQTRTTNRPAYSPVGYAPSVPRYLNNMPDAMISSRRTTQKIPTIAITKRIAWASSFSTEQIFEEGFKLLKYIRSLEDSGTRVRLIVTGGGECQGNYGACRITIKEPGERLNISKIAFPLVHPSMYRRLVFAWMERASQMTHHWLAYGHPAGVDPIHEIYYPKEIYIPNMVPKEYCC